MLSELDKEMVSFPLIGLSLWLVLLQALIQNHKVPFCSRIEKMSVLATLITDATLCRKLLVGSAEVNSDLPQTSSDSYIQT